MFDGGSELRKKKFFQKKPTSKKPTSHKPSEPLLGHLGAVAITRPTDVFFAKISCRVSYPTVTLSSVYQTDQNFKNIGKKELSTDKIENGVWSGKFTFSKSEYFEKLAPDHFGLLRGNAFLKFERGNERHR